MNGARLSALDASFLSVETPVAHMHVGWLALLAPDASGTLPSFPRLREHIEHRLARAPRYRQKLAPVPFGLQAPEWVDDRGFCVDRHVYRARGPLTELVDEIMSIPLRRDRPLWEIWACEDDESRQLALVGKAHHCMVDGIAAFELGSLLLDPTPKTPAYEPDSWHAEPEPGAMALLTHGIRDLLTDQVGLLRWPMQAALAPSRTVSQLTRDVPRVARALGHALSTAPRSPLQRPLTQRRSLAWGDRPLNDLRVIKRAHATTVNDVLLAAVAGGTRAFFQHRGEEPITLKAMVPVNVRDDSDLLGNQISFMFANLPCRQHDPVDRLECVHALIDRRKQDHEPEGAHLVLTAAQRAPRVVQEAISRIFASPRTFNLVVSNIPGPTQPLYMLGCPLRAAYPVVPLADHHTLSVGMTSINDRACFGLYTDPTAIEDAQALLDAIDAEISALLARSRRPRRRRTGTS
ncbi:MAG: wax ester/triacylglycerol synthase family O-acyltransferase [Solirubrobacteraceae bacterium]